MIIQGYGVGNTHTEWDGSAICMAPTIIDPVCWIEVLPEGIQTVNVAVMQVESRIKGFKYFVEKYVP